MKYCACCILPDSRPNLELDATSICSACRTHKCRTAIDWVAREGTFRDLVANAKRRRRRYDCLIPVSGGKDSTWQVVRCLEFGLHPLAVTWKTPARTEIGAANLANLVSLGVDHIDYQVNPRVERLFMLRSFERFGTTAIPMHMALFSIPLTVAATFDIPLVIWGENAAIEYGGAGDERTGFRLDSRWVRTYGVTHGTTAADWVSDDLTAMDLTPYFVPTDDELDRRGVLAVFLGYYFPWDPETSLAVATAHGFRRRPEGPKTGLYDYADIDDDFISIHHYLKWHKFGFTRLFDNLSIEIRNGRVTRDEAVAILRARGDQTPHDDIARFCEFVGIAPARFFEIAERFRNPDVWTRRDGRWVIDGFLVPDWSWT